MKLINKRAGEPTYIGLKDLLQATPFTCDVVETMRRNAFGDVGWEPRFSNAKKFLFGKDGCVIICTDGTTVQIDQPSEDVRFLNVQYVKVLEVVYVGVDD